MSVRVTAEGGVDMAVPLADIMHITGERTPERTARLAAMALRLAAASAHIYVHDCGVGRWARARERESLAEKEARVLRLLLRMNEQLRHCLTHSFPRPQGPPPRALPAFAREGGMRREEAAREGGVRQEAARERDWDALFALVERRARGVRGRQVPGLDALMLEFARGWWEEGK